MTVAAAPGRLTDIAAVRAAATRPLAENLPAESVYHLIQRAGQRFGERTAFTFLPDGLLDTPVERVSYRALAENVTRAANLFHRLGVREDDSVALLAPNIPVAHFALWGAETVAKACPINVLLDADHVAHLLDAANVTLIVALGPDPDLPIWQQVERLRERGRLPPVLVLGDEVPEGDGLQSFSDALATAPADRLLFDRELNHDTPAALFHTGGTTGLPKLALHRHGNQLHTSWAGALHYELSHEDVVLNGFPLFHVAGCFVYGTASFTAGAEQIFPTRTGMRNPAFIERFWAFVRARGITVIGGVPTTLAMMLDAPHEPEDLETVRLILSGGSPLPTELANAVEARFARPVRNIFGMTESAGLISVEPFAAERVAGSAGFPLPYTEVRAVALEDGRACLDRPLEPGATGVLVVRGPNVSPGYTDAERNPGTFEDGWLISGDMGHVDSAGRVFVTGRAKDVIIRGAHNIDPAVIEEAIAGHPAVEMCAAVGQPDAYAGELPVCYVSLKSGMSASADEIMVFAEPMIPEPPARPKRIVFLAALPVTPVGKIYKPGLRLDATAFAIRAALSSLCDSDGLRFELTMVDRGGSPVATLAVGDAPVELRARIEATLRDFTFEWSFDDRS